MKHTCIRLLALLFALLTLFALSSCKSKSDSGNPESPSKDAAGDTNDGLAGGEPSVSIPGTENRKIIKTYQIYSETKSYDTAVETLMRLTADCGGYVESSAVTDKSLHNTSDFYNRNASYTIRVPAERAEEFVGAVGNLLNVTSNQSHAEDVSETYYSVQARLEELQAERDSLLDILNAQETKQDYSLWLTVSQRLSEVRQQIAVYQGQLNRLDSQVSYSTVELSIQEVLNYSAVANSSFGSRLGNSFVDGWKGFWSGLQDFTVWFAGAIPVLLLLAVIGGSAAAIVVSVRRKKKR